jgi:hypothetical protein
MIHNPPLREVQYQLWHLRQRVAHKANRFRMAWRYAMGRLTTDDAQVITMDLRHIAGWYALAEALEQAA